MMDQATKSHADYVKGRFGLDTYVSGRGDVLADRNGKAIIASGREARLNPPGDQMQRLWDIRSMKAHATNKTAGYLAQALAGWVKV